ncbi:hypothetical protein CRUP_008481 [Coryphaenoides rupestris]|nr:hypothetical protein CRUP_008481 [Coryphaenoides rupestris]
MGGEGRRAEEEEEEEEGGALGESAGLGSGLGSVLMLTKHSLDLRLARDLELGREASDPHSPSREGVQSFPGRESRETPCITSTTAAAAAGTLKRVEVRLTSPESCSRLGKLLLAGATRVEEEHTKQKPQEMHPCVSDRFTELNAHQEHNRKLLYVNGLMSPWLLLMLDHWLTSGMDISLARWFESQGMRAELLRLPQAHQLLQLSSSVTSGMYGCSGTLSSLLLLSRLWRSSSSLSAVAMYSDRRFSMRATRIHARPCLFCTLLQASRMYSQKLRCPSELNQPPEPAPGSTENSLTIRSVAHTEATATTTTTAAAAAAAAGESMRRAC